ncbi:MAG: 4-hydroxy-tetrahydrodipicolinate reductase [Acidobacteriaceae bacterium]|nr:4-hydroxy-tetrahydrodipicolinate reductase [Acidobacteriaceae bacterium]
MNLLILGRGKTGSLVAEVARERHHDVAVLCSADNPDACALTPSRLAEIDVVIDFTTPKTVVQHIDACLAASKNMVVGTTGWYHELPRIRQLVEKQGTGLLYGANFSIGVNLFFDVARMASAALRHGYFGQIFERHHVQKKDAPSGTALILQRLIQDAAGTELEITSFREGDVVGMHELIFDSPADRIYLCHDAKSRRGFAEGAVRAAEWLLGKKGLFDFKDVAQKL